MSLPNEPEQFKQFQEIVRKKGLRGIKDLSNLGYDINSRNSAGKTLVHEAALDGDSRMLNALIENGANLEEMDKDNKTPLHDAGFGGNIQIAKTLIENGGLDPNSRDKNNVTPLHEAASFGDLKMAEYLAKEQNAEVNPSDKKGTTPLHEAASSGYGEVVKFLVEDCAASPDFKNKRGKTPLHIASLEGQIEAAKYLAENKHGIESLDKKGQTPLHKAALRDHREIAETLIEQGSNPNAADKSGETPLHLAAERGSVDIASYLLEINNEKGAKIVDVNQKNLYGETPLSLTEDSETKQLLLDFGAKEQAKAKTKAKTKPKASNLWEQIGDSGVSTRDEVAPSAQASSAFGQENSNLGDNFIPPEKSSQSKGISGKEAEIDSQNSRREAEPSRTAGSNKAVEKAPRPPAEKAEASSVQKMWGSLKEQLSQAFDYAREKVSYLINTISEKFRSNSRDKTQKPNLETSHARDRRPSQALRTNHRNKYIQ
jgi:ankyrin repeat protein